MASNIKVALQLDDRDYQTKLKSADAATKTFGSSAAASVTKINDAFGKLASGADTVRSKMESLGSAITGLAFAAFIQNLLQTSAAIKDVSESFGLTLTSTLELEAGFRKAGRSSDDMIRVLAALSSSAQDANDGNYGLQDSFRKLGISMDFLKKNDLPTTIRAIATAMRDNAGNTEILNAGYNILGKTAKGMPMGDLLAGLDAVSGKMGPAATATESLDLALKTMEANAAAVKREFMVLLTPVVDAFNAFTQGSDNSKLAAQALAAAMVVFVGGAVIVGINSVVQAFRGLAITLGLVSAGGATASAVTAGYTSVASASAAASIVQAAGLARVATAQMAVNVTQIELNALVASGIVEGGVYDAVINKLALSQARLATMTEAAALTQGQLAAATGGAAVTATAATGAFSGMLASLGAMALAAARFLGVVALITAAVIAVNAAIKYAFNFDPIDFFAKKLEKLIYDYLPALHSALEKVGSFFGMAPGTAAPAAKPPSQGTPTGAGFRTPGMGPQATAGPGVSVATGNQPTVTGPTLNPMAATEESLRAQGRLRELNLKLDKDRLDLQLKMVGKDDYTRAVEQSALDFKIKQQQEVQRLTDDIRKMEVTAANDKEGASKYGGQLAIMRQQLQTVKDQKDATTELVGKIETAKIVDKSRLQDMENMKKAIEDQILRQQALGDIIRGANEQAQSARSETPASLLVGLNSIELKMVEIDAAAKKAAQEAAKVFAEKFGEINSTADAKEFADGLEKIAKSYRGVATAQIEVAKANYETSRSFSTGWSDAFAKYAEDAQNSAEHAKTYFDRFTKGFEDAVVALVTNGKFSFKDFANSIIADFARIEARKALTSFMSNATPGGSVLGSLFNFGKSLFGFANGGTMQAGMPAIVGERGPELFMPNSAGRITSNASAFGRQEPTIINNAVTYSIQAVDASSFRSLVARDPSFMYAVTEQGRRSQPTRRSA